MNKETEQAINEAREDNLVSFDSVDALFTDLTDEEFKDILDLL